MNESIDLSLEWAYRGASRASIGPFTPQEVLKGDLSRTSTGPVGIFTPKNAPLTGGWFGIAEPFISKSTLGEIARLICGGLKNAEIEIGST